VTDTTMFLNEDAFDLSDDEGGGGEGMRCAEGGHKKMPKTFCQRALRHKFCYPSRSEESRLSCVWWGWWWGGCTPPILPPFTTPAADVMPQP
jgi:hypothetical protein